MRRLSPSLINDLQTVLDDKRPPHKLRSMAVEMGPDVSLKAIGFKESDIPEAVGILASMKYPNPVPVDKKLIETLFKMAWHGSIE